MRLVKTPSYIKKLFPNLIWSKKEDNKVIYLTFDDGPTPEITDWVLSKLKKHDAKATFFCLGKNVAQFPLLFNKIKSEGHQVGNHTYNHLNAWKTPSANYIDDVKKCSEVIDSKLFRPPYGKFTPKLNRQLSTEYQIILWDVISYDFDASLTPEQCYTNVVKHAKKGSIIVFHDSEKAFINLKECLPKVLHYLKNEGFTFKTL